jgi:hypothetical protein
MFCRAPTINKEHRINMSNTGWTDEAEVNFDDVPDELVNLPDAVYIFDFARITPKKTQKGIQALEVVLKAASVHPTSHGVLTEVPKGAKGLYETVMFGGESLSTAKNLLKAAGVELPKKINFEVLSELAQALLDKGQIIAKTNTSAARGGFAAKSRVARFYSEESLAASLATGGDASEAPAAASPAGRRGRRGQEQAAA